MTLTTTPRRTAHSAAWFWKAAGITAFSSLLLPRVNAVIYDHEKIWELDSEARVLAPLVVVVALAMFALIGRPLWRGRTPAIASLVAGIVAVLGILGYFLSLPIMVGGLAVTLGLEALARPSDVSHHRLAIAGVTLGVAAATVNAVFWLLGV
jgi:hypothetical protein